jgi:L-rhamnose mutarotase
MAKKDVVAAIRRFRDARLKKDEYEKVIKEVQPELIDMLVEIGVDNKTGIVWDEDDKSKGAAYIQQNSAMEYWDEDEIITYLKKSKARWIACSSRVLDIRKFEAEVANGNIPPKVAKKFKKTGDRPNPFIRFGKVTKESIR